ncbi:hypothetical protein F5X99DRAFT_422148 [Biscogniauxia marginata]|nr:hypothetical protein F5X99DRAFT_422148 [Biscogniauxia marginata]
MVPTYVLITGANRGLGFKLAKRFLALPNYTVITANRNPEHPTSHALAELPKAEGSSLVVIKYDAGCLREGYGVDHLDLVVANAGIARAYPAVKDGRGDDILEHIRVNMLSVASLYQATCELLRRSAANPVYGASNPMANWYGVRIHGEDEWLTAFVVDPGWVQTDMGNAAARGCGMEAAPDTLDRSCDGMVWVLTAATREKYGGKVVLYTGEIPVW